MKLEEIRAIARSHGIKPGKFSKTELIKRIQVAEGNFDCFATARAGECDQVDCRRRGDCLSTAKK